MSESLESAPQIVSGTLEVDLPENGGLQVRVGMMPFLLSRSATGEEITLREDPSINEQWEAMRQASAEPTAPSEPRVPAEINLAPGERVRFGIAFGVEVFGADGQKDVQRAALLLDPILKGSILLDETMEPYHTTVAINSGYHVTIQNEANNGTGVLLTPGPTPA
jgi:hypothetical protein